MTNNDLTQFISKTIPHRSALVYSLFAYNAADNPGTCLKDFNALIASTMISSVAYVVNK